MASRATKRPADPETEPSFEEAAHKLASIGREFYRRGWVLGTSGNFSAVISRNPLRLAISGSGIDKSGLDSGSIVTVDKAGSVAKSPATSGPEASAETLLHLAIAEARGAGAVLHTHSVWATILSEEYSAQGGIAIEGYEMLKGLSGVRTNEHREWLPILDNCQEMAKMASAVALTLQEHPASHGFLVRGHGVYTWGRDLEEAKRHVEILEFLLEVLGRRLSVLWSRKASHFRRRPRASKQK